MFPATRSSIFMTDNKQWIVGTPDDCIQRINELQEMAGGFGGMLVRAEDWAPRDKLHRSYELMARYVMPQFQGHPHRDPDVPTVGVGPQRRVAG